MGDAVGRRRDSTGGRAASITIAILAALGRREELALHLRATRNTGATPEEIREALLHVAVYAGVPAANSAFALAKDDPRDRTPTAGRRAQRRRPRR